jgi:hypothetical protein
MAAVDPSTIASLVSVCLGLGLAAACGFRVFVPLLAVNLAARAGYLSLGDGFDWIAGMPALITLTVATVLEIGAYYIPWLDNLLDTVASPAAVVAGAVVTASVVAGLDPYLKWTLAVIAGGGVAGAVQALTSGTRHASAVTTAGLANPVVSTVELVGSAGLSLLAMALPVVAALLVLLSLAWAARRLFGRPSRT